MAVTSCDRRQARFIDTPRPSQHACVRIASPRNATSLLSRFWIYCPSDLGHITMACSPFSFIESRSFWWLILFHPFTIHLRQTNLVTKLLCSRRDWLRLHAQPKSTLSVGHRCILGCVKQKQGKDKCTYILTPSLASVSGRDSVIRSGDFSDTCSYSVPSVHRCNKDICWHACLVSSRRLAAKRQASWSRQSLTRPAKHRPWAMVGQAWCILA